MSAPAPIDTPHSKSRIRIACTLLVFIVSLTVYKSTLAPTVTFVDSGELIVAASSLGVAHPPGFPLYVLLTHLATLVPIGNVAVRVNFASALFAALASAVVSLVVIEAMMTPKLFPLSVRAAKKPDRKKGRKGAAPQQFVTEAAPRNWFAIVVTCLVSGLLLAFSRTVWAYATIAEVYTLTSLLILLIFLLLFRWRRLFVETYRHPGTPAAQKEEKKSGGGAGVDASAIHRPSRPVNVTPRYGLLYSAAFLFGLALGVHHVSVGLMLPAFGALVLATAGIDFFRSRHLIYAALFAFAGLFLVYAYLPIAASRSPTMNWGDPRTFERLWWQVTGRQYQVFFSYSLGTMADQFAGFIKLVVREFGPWRFPAGLALTLAGFVAVFRRDKSLFLFLALVIGADLLYSLGYEIAEDKNAYYLTTFIAMTIAAGFGAHWFIDMVTSSAVTSRARRWFAASLVLLVPLVALGGNWSFDNRSEYFIAQDYVDNILSTVEPGGMLLTLDWQVYSPMLYFQEIERRRKDAVIIDINQLRRSWYFDYLRKAYPATMEQTGNQVGAFLEDLRHWEVDPDLYQRDLTLNQRINSRFYEMITAFVSNHLRSAPVYLTLDIAGNREGADAELTKSLAASYQFVPQGLVFEVTSRRDFHQPSDPHLVTRGLADGSIEFDDDDVVKLKVLPVYFNMLYNRGRYLAAYGRHEQAIEAFKQSLSLNPGFTSAQQAVNESQNALSRGTPNNPR